MALSSRMKFVCNAESNIKKEKILQYLPLVFQRRYKFFTSCLSFQPQDRVIISYD